MNMKRLLIAATAAVAILAAGIGIVTAASDTTRRPAQQPLALTIRVYNRPVPAPPAFTYVLRCSPSGGSLPHAASACAALAATPRLLDAPARCMAVDVVLATVIGRVGNKHVELAFLGCRTEAAGWQRLAHSLGLASAAR
jgi:hypothetical protein